MQSQSSPEPTREPIVRRLEKLKGQYRKFIEDPMENEQGRIEACFALSWVATDEQMNDIVKRVQEFKSKEPKKQFIRGCYLEALLHRPVPGVSANLVEMIDKESDVEVRH